MVDYIKYFRSQAISFDRGTMMYWGDRHDGESFDIHPSDIPIGEIVTDVTRDKDPVQFIHTESGFRKV